MFYLLTIVICLAVVFLLIAVSFLFLLPVWWFLREFTNPAPTGRTASLLFWARMIPLLVSCVVTFGFVLPAFLKFEPRSTGETMGLKLLAPAACGLLVIVAMIVRTVRIARATVRAQALWLERSRELRIAGFRFPVYCVDGPGSLLAVTGVFRPRIFLSREIVKTLSPGEFLAALAHETAHVDAWDNLKQMLLKITRPPLWLSDVAWTNASEVAADEAALLSGASVLDLSSALVKTSRLGWGRPGAPANVTASHLVPVSSGSAVEARVRHLEALLDSPPSPSGRQRSHIARRYLLPAFLAVAVYATCFNVLLPRIHEVLEFLVR